MHLTKQICEDITWVGGNDRRISKFENIYPMTNGVSYNSYVIKDDKNCLLDTVDYSIGRLFLENIEHVLNGDRLDYIVVNHMEPDHCAVLKSAMNRYPEAQIVINQRTAPMIQQFFTDVDTARFVVVNEGDTLSLGKHELTFVMAPMVHWPEVMVAYDSYSKVLFSADAFGTFGTLDGHIFADQFDFDRDWLDDARRYYTNICGKYGVQVQNLLKKASSLDIKYICPLHGPIWRENIEYFVNKYNIWSKYECETKGVLIVFASMYGDTENAAEILASELSEAGVKNIGLFDVSGHDCSELVSQAFKYSHIVCASTTYNGEYFPLMEHFIAEIKSHGLKNRTIALMENGSWAPQAANKMKADVEEMKDMTILDERVTIRSSVKEDQMKQIEALAGVLAEQLK